MITKERIKFLAQETGFDACGVTSVKPHAKAEEVFRAWIGASKHGEMKYLEDFEVRRKIFFSGLKHAKSIIVLGVNYYSKKEIVIPAKAGIQRTKNGSLDPRMRGGDIKGSIARYAWGKDYHKIIPKRLEMLKEKIKEEAGDVLLESAVDTRPLLERSIAQRAGLGFIGKQTQLLSLQFGPWLFLTELITNLELEPDEPFSGNCGTCRICIDECPTEAIEEDGTVDARKCIAYLTIEHKSDIPVELRPKMKNWVFGCDECLNVCPYTAKQKESKWQELTSDAGFGPALDLKGLFQIESNGEYEKKFGETAISRAGRKQLLRNACVVLGNSEHPDAFSILEKALEDKSELVRRHAEWAIDRIKEKVNS